MLEWRLIALLVYMITRHSEGQHTSTELALFEFYCSGKRMWIEKVVMINIKHYAWQQYSTKLTPLKYY